MKFIPVIVLAALFALNAPAQETKTSAEATPGVVEGVKGTIVATVQAVDLKKREITLKGPKGKVETFTVDERVKRLGEVAPGDKIKVEYYAAISVVIRKPTAAEKQHPIEIVEGVAKAPKNESPAAGGLRKIKVVATVEAIDKENQMVTLKGPMGNEVEVQVHDAAAFKSLRTGDTVVATYVEGIAISLEKTASEKK